MKKDEPLADLFAAMDERLAAAKTEADKVRAVATMSLEVCRRSDLTERAQLNQLAYLSGMAAKHLKKYAGHLERLEA